jgi:hypothetical protein
MKPLDFDPRPIVQSLRSRGLIGQRSDPHRGDPKHRERIARQRKSRQARGLTSLGTKRLNRTWPQLRGLSGRQYKQAWNRLNDRGQARRKNPKA